jgi:hypothetical protein
VATTHSSYFKVNLLVQLRLEAFWERQCGITETKKTNNTKHLFAQQTKMSDDWDDYGEAEDDDDDYASASKQKNFLAQMKQGVADSKDEPCIVCGKNVIYTLQLRADGKVFHKTVSKQKREEMMGALSLFSSPLSFSPLLISFYQCFRCKQCNQTLSLGSFAALEGKYYWFVL